MTIFDEPPHTVGALDVALRRIEELRNEARRLRGVIEVERAVQKKLVAERDTYFDLNLKSKAEIEHLRTVVIRGLAGVELSEENDRLIEQIKTYKDVIRQYRKRDLDEGRVPDGDKTVA